MRASSHRNYDSATAYRRASASTPTAASAEVSRDRSSGAVNHAASTVPEFGVAPTSVESGGSRPTRSSFASDWSRLLTGVAAIVVALLAARSLVEVVFPTPPPDVLITTTPHSQANPVTPAIEPVPDGMAQLAGATFSMGSTPADVAEATKLCHRTLGPASCLAWNFPSQVRREQPARTVTLAPFLIDTYEVTRREFVLWLNSIQSSLDMTEEMVRLPTESVGRWVPIVNLKQSGLSVQQEPRQILLDSPLEKHPAVGVTWQGALLYCNSLGKTLPTEAQWEFAARGGTDARLFPWGFDVPSCQSVKFGRGAMPASDRTKTKHGECWSETLDRTVAVGTLLADQTRDGIFDLGGNVSEWVQDSFTETYPDCPAPCEDPIHMDNTSKKIVRGGSWKLPGVSLRGSSRGSGDYEKGYDDVGFRCADQAPATRGP